MTGPPTTASSPTAISFASSQHASTRWSQESGRRSSRGTATTFRRPPGMPPSPPTSDTVVASMRSKTSSHDSNRQQTVLDEALPPSRFSPDTSGSLKSSHHHTHSSPLSNSFGHHRYDSTQWSPRSNDAVKSPASSRHLRRGSLGSTSATSLRSVRISGPVFQAASNGLQMSDAEREEQRRSSLSDGRPEGLVAAIHDTSPASVNSRRRMLSTAYEDQEHQQDEPSTPGHRQQQLQSKWSQSPNPARSLKTPAGESGQAIPFDFLRKSFGDKNRPDAAALQSGRQSPSLSIRAKSRKLLANLNLNNQRTDPTQRVEDGRITPFYDAQEDQQAVDEDWHGTDTAVVPANDIEERCPSPTTSLRTKGKSLVGLIKRSSRDGGILSDLKRNSQQSSQQSHKSRESMSMRMPTVAEAGPHGGLRKILHKSTFRLRARGGSKPPSGQTDAVDRAVAPMPQRRRWGSRPAASTSPSKMTQRGGHKGSVPALPHNLSSGVPDSARGIGQVLGKRRDPVTQPTASTMTGNGSRPSTPQNASNSEQPVLAAKMSVSTPTAANRAEPAANKTQALRRLHLLARTSPKKPIRRPSVGPVGGAAQPHPRHSGHMRSSWIDITDEILFDGQSAPNGRLNHQQSWYQAWKTSKREAMAYTNRSAASHRPPPSSFQRYEAQNEGWQPDRMREPLPVPRLPELFARPASPLMAMGGSHPSSTRMSAHLSHGSGSDGAHSTQVGAGSPTHRKQPPARPLRLPILQERDVGHHGSQNQKPHQTYKTSSMAARGEHNVQGQFRRAEHQRKPSVHPEQAHDPRSHPQELAGPRQTSPPQRRPLAPLPSLPQAKAHAHDSLLVPALSKTRGSATSSAASLSTNGSHHAEPDAEPTQRSVSSVGTSILFSDVEIALGRLQPHHKLSKGSIGRSRLTTVTDSATSSADHTLTVPTDPASAQEAKLAAVIARLLCARSSKSGAPPLASAQRLLQALSAEQIDVMQTFEATEILSELVDGFRPSPAPSRRPSTRPRRTSAGLRTPERRLRRRSLVPGTGSSRGGLTPERRGHRDRESNATFANSIMSYASTPVSSSTEDITSLLEGMMDTSEAESIIAPQTSSQISRLAKGAATAAVGAKDSTNSIRPETGSTMDSIDRTTPQPETSSPGAVTSIIDLYKGRGLEVGDEGPLRGEKRKSPATSTSLTPCLSMQNQGASPSAGRRPPLRSMHHKRLPSRALTRDSLSPNKAHLRRLDLTRGRFDSTASSFAGSARPSVEPDDTLPARRLGDPVNLSFEKPQPAKKTTDVFEDGDLSLTASAKSRHLFDETAAFQASNTLPTDISMLPAQSPWVKQSKYSAGHREIGKTPFNTSLPTLTPPSASSSKIRRHPNLSLVATPNQSSSSLRQQPSPLPSPVPSLVITDADLEAKCRSLEATPEHQERHRKATAEAMPIRETALPPAAPAIEPTQVNPAEVVQGKTSAAPAKGKRRSSVKVAPVVTEARMTRSKTRTLSIEPAAEAGTAISAVKLPAALFPASSSRSRSTARQATAPVVATRPAMAAEARSQSEQYTTAHGSSSSSSSEESSDCSPPLSAVRPTASTPAAKGTTNAVMGPPTGRIPKKQAIVAAVVERQPSRRQREASSSDQQKSRQTQVEDVEEASDKENLVYQPRRPNPQQRSAPRGAHQQYYNNRNFSSQQRRDSDDDDEDGEDDSRRIFETAKAMNLVDIAGDFGL